jgi:CRP-like cAMP-binding protein
MFCNTPNSRRVNSVHLWEKMKNILIALSTLNDSDIDWLLSVGEKRKIAQGELLVQIGKPIDALYLLLEGQFGVFLNHQQIAQLSAGDIIGEMSLIDKQLPSATVKSLSDAQVLSISRPQIQAQLTRDLGFAARFYRMVALFLSIRLRGLNAQRLGAEAGTSLHLDLYDADEIVPDVLEDLALAGSRFDWMLGRLNLK